MHRHLPALAAAAMVAGLSLPLTAGEAPRVVATIAPVHSLVAGVMEGVGTPVLLVRGGGSPHSYALRPSEAAALNEARVVVWIGEHLETFLEKPLRALAGRAEVVTLAEVPFVARLPMRSGDAWETGEHEHEHEHEHEPGEEADDPHVWLDPRNARGMVEAIAASLERVDPDNAARYRENGRRLHEDLNILSRELEVRLAPVRHVPFVVFHDGYQYLEWAYGLNAVGAVALSPERAPGARHLSELRQRIVASGARCIFREPQFAPRLAETLADGTGARVGVLDPLGAALPPGPSLYPALMRANAAALLDCLSGG